MDKGVSCDHLNKLADVLGAELWKSKEVLACLDCGCPGPNLWICLQPDCHHVGCSEVKNDHSTIHQRNFPSHCVHMNVSTERVWCYACEREVHIRAALSHSRSSPDAAVGGSSSRLGFDHTVAMNVSIADDDDEAEDTDYGEDDERPRGLVGLQNMGNTCYMNAALQALGHLPPLAGYFLHCAPAVALLAGDKKPGLSRAYQKLIKEMWSRKTRGYVVPSGILYGIRNVHGMFRGYQQHDTQEFLRCFLDQLHEELKEPVYDDASHDKLNTEDGDHTVTKNVHMRRRAASSGASDAPLFARMRRKSPAPSSYSERTDGYFRVHSTSESGAAPRAATRHRRSASFAGTQQASYYTHVANGEKEHSRVDIGSESSLSCSSDAEERYETCSSASDSQLPHTKELPGCGGDGGGARYRSVVSDVFDGKLLSSVQCLICNRVSTRVETFQDLSLPIPSREHLSVLRAQQHALATQMTAPEHDSWLWWVLGWLRSWFYGPVVSLQDCLAAFFSADELKGDNMYSCSRCSKLRNGVKISRLVRLPEVVCIHLKRFRHELAYSSKLAAAVTFPTTSLDLAPYRHPQCTSKITRYSLAAVICHSGTAGGGHYTCAALNDNQWYSFDDASVSRVTHAQLAAHEAYVLFYRKVNPEMEAIRRKVAEIIESTPVDPNEVRYYISKQWIVKFNTWAEPGPIDNSDFVCPHGAVRPERARRVDALAAQLAAPAWRLLYRTFGGGPACTRIVECGHCARAAERLRARRGGELAAFYDLHAIFQEQERPRSVYAISMHWFRQWQAFVRSKTREPPPPVDNNGIVTKQETDGVTTFVLKQGSDHAQLSEELWRFFTEIYGGGPEVRLSGPPPAPADPAPAPRPLAHRPIRKQSESDKEEYCAKSTSETNINDMAQKNKSLQNIFNRRGRKQTESDDDVSYRQVQYKRHEPNGNYQDSDEEMDVSPPQNHTNTIRMENGVDSSDHDANDNPVHHNKKSNSNDVELPNLDSISLKAKPKSGKYRRSKRRTVK